jgi:uncharacterized membrane protein YphA (DoxX/SURF4 family)
MITAPDLAPTRRRLLAYWIFTTIVVAESLAGGVTDLMRLDPFFPLLTKLGYPAYLATILGIAKILGGLTVAAPRLPRLKEWAYAGILINMLGATASYLATRGSLSDYIPPLSFAAFALISWALRPPGRRLQDNVTTSVTTGTEYPNASRRQTPRPH